MLASRPSSNCPKGLANYVNKISASPTSEFAVQYDSLGASQCKRGLEEACRFLSGDIACVEATENGNMPVATKRRGLKVGINRKEQQGTVYGLRGRKNLGREELRERKGRFDKQLAASKEEIEVSEMFERIWLCEDEPEPFASVHGKTSNAAITNMSPVGCAYAWLWRSQESC